MRVRARALLHLGWRQQRTLTLFPHDVILPRARPLGSRTKPWAVFVNPGGAPSSCGPNDGSGGACGCALLDAAARGCSNAPLGAPAGAALDDGSGATVGTLKSPRSSAPSVSATIPDNSAAKSNADDIASMAAADAAGSPTPSADSYEGGATPLEPMRPKPVLLLKGLASADAATSSSIKSLPHEAPINKPALSE